MMNYTNYTVFKSRFGLLILLCFPLLGFTQNQIALLPNGKKVILYEDKTWAYHEKLSYDFNFDQLIDNRIPDFLRQGIDVDKKTLKIAVEMYLQGWHYTMPRPKSRKAEWGYEDGRTTWWNGYWYNDKTLEYSRLIPEKQANGYYDGDEQEEKKSWRNGGSPPYPSAVEWLLSSKGGVKPNSSEALKSKSYQSRNFKFD